MVWSGVLSVHSALCASVELIPVKLLSITWYSLEAKDPFDTFVMNWACRFQSKKRMQTQNISENGPHNEKPWWSKWKFCLDFGAHQRMSHFVGLFVCPNTVFIYNRMLCNDFLTVNPPNKWCNSRQKLNVESAPSVALLAKQESVSNKILLVGMFTFIP